MSQHGVLNLGATSSVGMHLSHNLNLSIQAFADIVVRDSEMVCVELVATDKGGDFQAVIFIGSIRYEALRTVFESRVSLCPRPSYACAS